jgi:hypothetical protein
MTILGSIGSGNNQAWADVIEGTEGPDFIVGTPGDDIIDSKGNRDDNYGDTVIGDGSGDDVIFSGEGHDLNYGDTEVGDGSGNDVIFNEMGVEAILQIQILVMVLAMTI